MIDWTKPIETRDGREARLIQTDKAGSQPVVAVFRDEDGEWELGEFCRDGKFFNNGDKSETDLVNVGEREVRWFGVEKLTLFGASLDGNVSGVESPDQIDGFPKIKVTFKGGELHSVELVKEPEA